MMRKYFLAAALLIFGAGVFVSCRDDRNLDCPYGFKRGTIVYNGAIEVDGCGWLILMDSVYYHPVNLGSGEQIDGLDVLLKYVDDPQEFRCGRGGAEYPSIRITEIRKSAEEVGILKEDEWDKYSMDPFHLDSAYVEDDWLMMRVGYSGGCKNHDLHLWKLPPNALNPPPVELALSHDANGDMCEAYITRWLVFSLVPLREEGKREITFLLRGSPEMSAYYRKFTYRY